MALYITHSIFHLARLLYVRPETFEPYYLPYLYVQPSSWRWIFRFETCRRHQKLKYEYRKGAFCWFILYNCITMHGAKNIKMPSVIHDLHYHLALIIPHNNKVHKPLCALHRHYQTYRHTHFNIEVHVIISLLHCCSSYMIKKCTTADPQYYTPTFRSQIWQNNFWGQRFLQVPNQVVQ